MDFVVCDRFVGPNEYDYYLYLKSFTAGQIDISFNAVGMHSCQGGTGFKLHQLRSCMKF